MRMGFGIRDESKNTKIHFVTTGYLVSLSSIGVSLSNLSMGSMV
jgi:hypothetical protein